MMTTLTLQFKQKGAEATAREAAKLEEVVARLRAQASQPIAFSIGGMGGVGKGGGGGVGGGGGGRSRTAADPERAAEKAAAAAEKAAARQAAAAEKAAARQAVAAERLAQRQAAAAERAAARQVAAAERVHARQFGAAEKAAARGDWSGAMGAAGDSAKIKASVEAWHKQAQAAERARSAWKAAGIESQSLTDDMRAAGISQRDWAGGMSSVVSGLGAVGSAAAAAAAAIALVVAGAVEGATALAGLAAEGEKLKVVGKAYEALGGSAKEMEKLRELTGGVVGDTDLQKAMNLAKLFKLPAQEIPKMIKLSQGAAAAMGETTAKMMSDIFTSASRGSKLIADNLGIIMGDLGKVNDDYAKKIGKMSGDQLTDAERTQAFVAKMIAEGGKQMELASIAQGDAAAKAAAQWDNLSGNMKVAVAEMFSGLGVWDALTSKMGEFEAFVKGGVAQAGEYLGPLFQGLADILPPVVKAVGALLPLLKPLGQLLSYAGAIIEVLVPVVGALASAVSTVATEIIDWISMGLEPLLRAGAEVAGLFSDDMAAAYERAADAMANARAGIGETTEAIKRQGDAAGDAVKKWTVLADAQAKITAQTIPANKHLAALGATLTIGFGATGATASAAYRVNNLTKDMALLTAQAQKQGKSLAEAQKEAALQLAIIWGVPVAKAEEASKRILATQGYIAEETEAAAQAAFGKMKAWGDKEKGRIQQDNIAKLDDFNRLYFDLAERQTEYASFTSEIWRKAGDDEKKALEELDKWRDDMMAKAQAAWAHDAEQYAAVVGAIAKVHHTAFEAMGLGSVDEPKKKEKRGSGGSKRGDKDMSGLLERAAQLGMSERQRALADADRQFKEDMKAAEKSAEGIAAAQALYADARLKAWADAGRAQLGELQARGSMAAELAKQWLDDAHKVVEMTRAAEEVLKRARLGAEDVTVGDPVEGITRRRTAREVEVQLEIEALKREWEAKAAALQVGSDAYNTVLAEHHRKVADLTKEGMAEQARADAESTMEARLGFVKGFGEVWGSVSGQIQELIEQGTQAEESVGYVLGGFLSLGAEIEGTKAQLTDIQEKVNKGQMSETQAGVAGAGQLAAAIGRSSASIIKNKQAQAYVEALVQVGLAAAAYATPGMWAQGVGHTAAAAALFVAAGRGGGGGSSARSLTPRRSAAGSDRTSTAGDQRKAVQQINVFVNQITGQAIVDATNRDAQRRAGIQFNSRLLPNGSRVPSL